MIGALRWLVAAFTFLFLPAFAMAIRDVAGSPDDAAGRSHHPGPDAR